MKTDELIRRLKEAEPTAGHKKLRKIGEKRKAPTSYDRGHLIWWHKRYRCWYYDDTGLPQDPSRECIRCGVKPTPEGHDACLGHLEGVTSACCGHGVHRPILMKG
jgi:hypothetical protein